MVFRMKNKTRDKERVFSVELKSRRNLKNVTLTNSSSDSVLVEGTIGELVQATFAEGIILEVVGKNGVLRPALLGLKLMQEGFDGFFHGRPPRSTRGIRIIIAQHLS